MAPYVTASLQETEEEDIQLKAIKIPDNEKYAYESQLFSQLKELKWFNIAIITALHVIFLKELVTYPFLSNMDLVIFNTLHGSTSAIGISSGVHRLWTHHSYKAKLPLRIFWMLWSTAAGMGTIYDWVRDHRLHHKYVDTHADPYNARRGFFFSHVGWLFVKKRPEVIEKGKQIDMSDLLADPVVRFQQKYYIPLLLLLAFVVPSIVPPLLWGKPWFVSIQTGLVGRYVIVLNFIWSINSVSHFFGYRPYNKNITATDYYYTSYFTLGEGWHNFHHAFPWAYKFGRFAGGYADPGAFWIDQFAKIGWAYDLKMPSSELIKKASLKAGDGSHPLWGSHMEIPESAEQELIDNKHVTNTNTK